MNVQQMNPTRAGRRASLDGVKEKGTMERVKWVLGVMLLAALVVGAPQTVSAQFNSGSSGVHGVFPPVPSGGSIPSNYSALVWNIRTGKVAYCGAYTTGTGLDVCDVGSNPNVEAQIAGTAGVGVPDGVYHFSSFSFVSSPGVGRNIWVVGTSPNVPLTILSQTDITISGIVNDAGVGVHVRGWDGRAPSGNAPSLSVPGGLGGPGGFNGGASGNGGSTPSNGSPGFGPAGGAAGVVGPNTIDFIATSALQTALNPSLSPLTGGSSGGGGAGFGTSGGASCSNAGYAGGSGGGGGGALLLAASNRVTIGNGANIMATGGTGGGTANGCGFGGGGAGGSVRIVAQEITGNGAIQVQGGNRGNGTLTAAGGQVRFEAAFNTFSGQITGAVGGSFVSFPTAPLPANQPQLAITAINSQAVNTSNASMATPDITFANALTSAVPVTVTASNVPLGTQVQIRVVPAVGAATSATTTGLSGSVGNSTATASVVLPPGAGIVTATASFNISGGQQALNGIRFDGELAQRMEVVTQPDGTSNTYVIASSGARFEIGVRQ